MWSSTLTLSADRLVLARIRSGFSNLLLNYTVGGRREPIYDHSLLDSDSNWDYYSLGLFSSGSEIGLQLRQDTETHWFLRVSLANVQSNKLRKS